MNMTNMLMTNIINMTMMAYYFYRTFNLYIKEGQSQERHSLKDFVKKQAV